MNFNVGLKSCGLLALVGLFSACSDSIQYSRTRELAARRPDLPENPSGQNVQINKNKAAGEQVQVGTEGMASNDQLGEGQHSAQDSNPEKESTTGSAKTSDPINSVSTKTNPQMSTTAPSTSAPGAASTGAPTTTNNPSNEGVLDGHFDLNTLHQGRVKHTHAYDDDYRSTGVDFFDIRVDEHFEIDNSLVGKRFAMLIYNASKSPAGKLRINNTDIDVLKYDSDTKTGRLPVYTLNSNPPSGETTLRNFSINFGTDAIRRCRLAWAEKRDVENSKNGDRDSPQFRAGALTILAFDADTLDTNGRPTATSLVLWETNIFYHAGTCTESL